MKESLREKLINYLEIYKTLDRGSLTDLVKKWGYEKSNSERRLREICVDYPVKRYDANGKEVTQSKWICFWKLTGKIKKSVILK